jgi:hypothetical protein
LVSVVCFFEVHLHHRAVVKELEEQRLATSEMGVQAQLEVTVSAYGFWLTTDEWESAREPFERLKK